MDRLQTTLGDYLLGDRLSDMPSFRAFVQQFPAKHRSVGAGVVFIFKQ